MADGLAGQQILQLRIPLLQLLMQTIKHENCSSAMRACKRGRQAGTRRRADARVAFRLRAEAGRADLPLAPAGAGLQWAALRRRWPQPAPLISPPQLVAAHSVLLLRTR